MYANLLENLSKKIEHYFSEIEAPYGFDYGPEFEIALCKILVELLPTKFGVCRGFIADRYGTVAGDDIIIYDRLRFPTIRMLGENFSQKEQVPIEAVYCYIEAKHNLELDDDEEATFKKALRQLKEIRKMEREPRPLNQVTETVTLGGPFTINAPQGWTESLNPIHISIISRKTSLKKDMSEKGIKKGFLNGETTYKAINNIPIPNDCVPDLIVAGEEVVMLPIYQSEESRHIMPLYWTNKTNGIQPLRTKHSALAVGLCQILWALERIQLDRMPWEEIIGNSLHGVQSKSEA